MQVKAVLAIAAVVSIAAATTSSAAELPAIKTSEANPVPECATPGRLMAFLRSRNQSLEPSFEKIAVDYMRIGEELGVRWDIAFYQMAVETGYLSFKRDGARSGDVKPSQNNFAGLGATGRGQQGESFKDVPTGVRAHLQHVLMYSGETIENPIAERTRSTQQWLVKQMQGKGVVTYNHLAQRWAAADSYAQALATHLKRFEGEFCSKADPHPELLAEARGEKPKAVAAADPRGERVSGRDLARKAIEDGKADVPNKRLSLGATALAKQADPAKPAEDVKPVAPAAPAVTIINPTTPSPEKQATVEKPAVPVAPEKPVAEKKAVPFAKASAAGQLARPQAPAQALPKGAKCKVLTASYGGQKAILIQASSDGAVQFTVLDVNEGNEKREAEAYISAYAKGGAVAGEFASHTQAIDKAFELCPEG